jgi:Ca2+/Na+ antiporter
MKTLNIKHRRYFPGIWLLVTILLLFILLFSPIRNVGIVFICIVALYVAISSYAKFSNTDQHPFRSRARDQIFKDRNKIS